MTSHLLPERQQTPAMPMPAGWWRVDMTGGVSEGEVAAEGGPGHVSGAQHPVAPGASGAVAALMSARPGGASLPPYDGFNLGDHVGDDPVAVARNRAAFADIIRATPQWLTQVHGRRIVRLSRALQGTVHGIDCVDPASVTEQPRADGVITTEPGLACSVMVADCLPLLLAAPEGRGVAALHAGWRGLAGAGDMHGRGIVQAGVHALCEATGCAPSDLQAWLGPCIGPERFEVGPDVLAGFGVDPAQALSGHPRFRAQPLQPDRWLADLPGLARDALHALGVRRIGGGQWCTVSDASRFFSFRRDGVTGRQAAAIWLR